MKVSQWFWSHSPRLIMFRTKMEILHPHLHLFMKVSTWILGKSDLSKPNQILVWSPNQAHNIKPVLLWVLLKKIWWGKIHHLDPETQQHAQRNGVKGLITRKKGMSAWKPQWQLRSTKIPKLISQMHPCLISWFKSEKSTWWAWTNLWRRRSLSVPSSKTSWAKDFKSTLGVKVTITILAQSVRRSSEWALD